MFEYIVVAPFLDRFFRKRMHTFNDFVSFVRTLLRQFYRPKYRLCRCSVTPSFFLFPGGRFIISLKLAEIDLQCSAVPNRLFVLLVWRSPAAFCIISTDYYRFRVNNKTTLLLLSLHFSFFLFAKSFQQMCL